MKIRAKFTSIFAAACGLVFLSLPASARPPHPPQDQQTSQTQSVPKGEKQKVEPGSGKEIGKGGEDIGKGAGKGAESLGKGTAEGAGNLVTLHPATPPLIWAKARVARPRMSESALERARPRS